ncbi:Protein FAM49 like protein [Tritrichomonas foetus]|uniref:Protein FAM49 like protein n=1 Tax=Tritrichomonas foetus TaxID=1144522 RepID=A0A1J4JBD6_9EUKA|nr:Protein FAM49 like protein [Tritrichomonas foetus]|eukprot:OHS96506.1 Protein FAM49 like protein [Tritrichomonas foetus]
MGGLFSTLNKKSLPEIAIDLEKAPSPAEEPIFNQFRSTVLEPSISIFEQFSKYKDGQEFAALALSNPSEETKGNAWDAILPNIYLQMEVFDFAKKVSDQFIKLINVVMTKTANNSFDVFSEMPAITKCFIDCFDIILRFDEIKLTLPKLLNDLAFFRRNVQNYNDESQFDDLLDKSNSSTIFWAASTPMLNDAITTLQTTYQANSPDHEKLLVLIGSVSDIATMLLTRSQHTNPTQDMLCLRCIVGATLIYDHINSQGAFLTKSNFHVKEAMEAVVNFSPKQNNLINAVKYSSKHLGDATSDPKIKQLFQ